MKPHIIRFGARWVCYWPLNASWAGYGLTPSAAYRDFLRIEGV